MGQPSKAAAIFLFLFGLPFLGMGLIFALASLFSSPLVHNNGNPIAGAIFGSVFALIGAGLMGAAIYGYRKQREQAATQASNPGAPWLWQSDWSNGRALSRNRNSVFGWWIGVGLAGMIVGPIVATNLPTLLRNSDPKALVLLGLCLFPLILLIGAVRATMRRERYGKTYFEFNSLPFSPGKRLSGQIHLHLETSADHGIDLRLACIRRIVTGSGRDQTVNQAVLWQDEKNVPQSSLAVGPLDTTIPVDFGIPQDAYETNHDNPRDQLLWVLHAKADVPGIDYSDSFEVPVFRSGSSATSSAAATFDATTANFSSNFAGSFGSTATATAPAFESDASEVSASPNPKAVISTTSDGSTQFYFPPFRNKVQTLILIVFTAVWSGIVYFLSQSKAPWFFAVFFGFFDLLLIYGCFQYVFGSTRIVVGNGKIASLRKIFGSEAKKEVLFGNVQSILATVGIQNSSANSSSYAIRLQSKDGKNITLADNILDRQEARWIVSQIEKLAGLKTDTHVALQGSFGNAYAPPPQRVFTVTCNAPGNVPAQSNPKRNVVGGLIGFAMFLAWGGFIAYKFIEFQPTSPHSSTTNVRKPVSRPTYAALTDEGVQRLHALPMQEQAEELLDRAIQHDPRALELFEQNIGSPEWLGQIKLTDRMKDLERRSEFSTDLRVRYASADLNLSMDGWSKNDDGADKLIERARNDAAYRPAAVYFMGMMAGRGVAYDRIYPVLLDYAKHDPDARVRQWAVEGMRYLGTDEALDQLFEIFTTDPSMQVRDRAGCNVSDCGNFKRTQRLRMVPQLLILVADSSATAQMRSWGFLALHEITDQNLPNDAAAWQSWYDQHGAEKLAELEQADWWQVHGDE
ncbi:MAG TPA: HEAT repeat domain-containing protein [Terriglobales bacterium]|nr:HEAT repeat domain-containing protein [Terriglobales bacterium]